MAPAAAISVLVVDSYPDTAETTALVLLLNGIAARVTHGCEEALAAARTCPPTAVVLDVSLKDGNGYQLLDALRSALDSRPLVVVVTAAVGGEVRSRMAGCDHHLTKPADPRALVALLERHAAGLWPLTA